MKKDEECLIVFLEAKPYLELLRLTDPPCESVLHAGESYRPRVDTGWNGFYDWLGFENRRIVGITWFCFEDFYFLLDVFENLTYAKVEYSHDGSPFFTIFFQSNEGVNYSSYGDQDFGYNWLFESDSGKLAVSFRASYVSEYLNDGAEIVRSI